MSDPQPQPQPQRRPDFILGMAAGVALGIIIGLLVSKVVWDRLDPDRDVEDVVNLPTPPDPKSQGSLTESSHTMKIEVADGGVYRRGDREFTEEELTKEVETAFAEQPDLKVLVVAGAEVKHVHLANLLSICRFVGIKESNIAVRTKR